MAKVTGTWHKKASSQALQRSSQVLSMIGDRAYIFGGELEPRKPRDNDVYEVNLSDETSPTSAVVNTIPSDTRSPGPRVGSASTTLDGKMYIFSGRGGPSMSPIDKHGSFNVFDPTTSAWSLVAPTDLAAPRPPPRSYHCLAASAATATIYLHAGCPETGRCADLWSFDVGSKAWTRRADAPGPPRGGASIAFADGLLYRMHGFDGTREQGGAVDVYDPVRAAWETVRYEPDNRHGPVPGSVSVLLPVRVGGRGSLVTLFGELDPSALGHAGAGKMSSFVWVYDILDRRWSMVEVAGGDGGVGTPRARGWFGGDVWRRELGGDRDLVVVHGGLGEDNERLDDLWVLELKVEVA